MFGNRSAVIFLVAFLLGLVLQAEPSSPFTDQAPNTSYFSKCGKSYSPQASIPNSRAVNLQERQLASKAAAILEKRCAHCHNPKSDDAGRDKVLDILDSSELIAKKIVIPKKYAGSLLQKVLSPKNDRFDRMPKGEERLSPQEKLEIEKWVEVGAPSLREGELSADFGFISNADIERCILEDVESLEYSEREFQRYLTLTHFYNALKAEAITESKLAISKLLNSLSWKSEMAKVKFIDPARTILRFDLRAVGWNVAKWNLILAKNPYGVKIENASSKELLSLFGEKSPHVRGDWFVAAAARPPLYNDLLELPKTLQELKRLVNAKKQVGASRAGTYPSGVAKLNRVVERLETEYGILWESFDFDSDPAKLRINPDKKNIFFSPLDFQNDAGEIIFSLKNGLHAYMLNNSAGVRQDEAPLTIVKHNKRVADNFHIVNGLSCFDCHDRGMIPVQEKIREHVERNSSSFSDSEREKVKAQYFSQDELDKYIASDIEVYETALKKALGLEAKSALPKEDPIHAVTVKFEAPVDQVQMASELGLKVENFKKLLRDPDLGRKLAVDAAGLVDRVSFNKEFLPLFENVQRKLVAQAVAAVPPSPVQPTTTKINDILVGESIDINVHGEKITFIPILLDKLSVTFEMGSSDPEAGEDEVRHTVELTKKFAVATTEVTKAVWSKVMGETVVGIGNPYLPITNKTYREIQTFVKRLRTLIPNKRFRLLKEAEWEFVARAGTRSKFFHGDLVEKLGEFAWFKNNANGELKNVATRKPNPLGLYDILGNASEFVEDFYIKNRSTLPKRNPENYTRGFNPVVRGGSVNGYERSLRVSYRDNLSPDKGDPYVGFRLAFEGDI